MIAAGMEWFLQVLFEGQDWLSSCVCVEQVHTVFNRQSDKPRGYAFIEFDHERDMHGTLI